ncbi:MAG TPA: hypothetical protein GXX40_01545 [Firmicutes bacterium]|nr:hypothetical protein [Bacillota bacterium]
MFLRQGSIADAVRAGISVPGLFAPVKVNGRVLVDGGLVSCLLTHWITWGLAFSWVWMSSASQSFGHALQRAQECRLDSSDTCGERYSGLRKAK